MCSKENQEEMCVVRACSDLRLWGLCFATGLYLSLRVAETGNLQLLRASSRFGLAEQLDTIVGPSSG